jgi:hypothetical protein
MTGTKLVQLEANAIVVGVVDLNRSSTTARPNAAQPTIWRTLELFELDVTPLFGKTMPTRPAVCAMLRCWARRTLAAHSSLNDVARSSLIDFAVATSLPDRWSGADLGCAGGRFMLKKMPALPWAQSERADIEKGGEG